MKEYQLIVIGAGPGGYEAAIRAAQLGLTTALIERRDVGGTCLNRGCIPTKAMLHSAQLYREAANFELFGLHTENTSFDWAKVHQRKNDVVVKLRTGIEQLIKANKIDFFNNSASISGKNDVQLDQGEVIRGENILIATGSVPARPPIPGLDLPNVVTSDELLPEARITGFKGVTRTSFCHVLNARATSHKYAETLGRRYEDMNLVVAHLGGGISISAHRHGRIIDSVSDDAGPFSPDRSGSLNMLYVVDLCYSGKYTKKDMLKKLRGEGGMSALLGTHDCREIERRIQEGDEWAALVYQAQALQIAKGVGIMLGCFTELIDAVILTGGLAYSKMLTDMVIGYLHNLARVVVIPGENEMEALALGGLRLLRGEEPVHTFAPACDLSVIP